MGIAGGVLIAVGLVLFAVSSTSLPLIALVFVLTIGAAIVLAVFALRRIKKSKGTIYLNQDQEGYKASGWAEEMVGKGGVVVADLKPSGHVEFEGKRYQAVARMGYLSAGTKVVVVGGEGAHLVVKRRKND